MGIPDQDEHTDVLQTIEFEVARNYRARPDTTAYAVMRVYVYEALSDKNLYTPVSRLSDAVSRRYQKLPLPSARRPNEFRLKTLLNKHSLDRNRPFQGQAIVVGVTPHGVGVPGQLYLNCLPPGKIANYKGGPVVQCRERRTHSAEVRRGAEAT